MERKFSTRDITITAMLLAMCIVFQSLKSLSVYLTGSAVNCILVIAVLTCGLASGSVIAVLTPVIAYFMGATPIMNMIPLMIFVIAIGNELLVLVVWLLYMKRVELGMIAGCVAKAGFLWLSVWYAILPTFGGKLPAPMVATVKMTFSITQFVTALIGCAIAWVLIRSYGAIFRKDTQNDIDFS